MWPKQTVKVLSILGIPSPLIQAPMAGGATTPELIASVANAGGLGSLGAGYMPPEAIRMTIQRVQKLTTQPFSVNLFIPQGTDPTLEGTTGMVDILNHYRQELGLDPATPTTGIAYGFEEQLEVVLAEKVPIVSFTFGIPAREVIDRVKGSGALAIGTATTVREGIQLAAAGCDLIVAQGSEAGGHRGTFAGPARTSLIGTMALVPQLADRVDVGVIAAGGIMDGRGLAAALVLGASGAQMGTAFLTCEESGIHKRSKEAILAGDEESTVLTSVFTGKLARGMKNRFIEEMEAHLDRLPGYPAQHFLTQGIRQEAARQERLEFMSLWAGQGIRMSRAEPAAQLVKRVVAQALHILGG